MVTIASLWLPILLSAVVVFVASFVVHMLVPFHRSDYRTLPNEDQVMDALRQSQVASRQSRVRKLATRTSDCPTARLPDYRLPTSD